ncbi:MAG TPA: polysaccharide deacetylase [Acidobacteriota bacterium]
MKRIFRGCLITAALLSVPLGAAVNEYRTYFARTTLADGAPAIVIRRFTQKRRSFCLVVNPQTLATEIVPLADLKIASASLADLRREFASSPYDRALAEAAANSMKLEDAGIAHRLPAERGVSLTIDLCPSKKPLDRFLFKDILAAFSKAESPVPLAIAVAGIWMKKHPADLRWLAGLAHSGKITVDWINHSYHHKYDPRLPLRRNFLLEKGVDLNEEVLRTEQKMIECGLTPSVFFRFPGLVSDPAEFARILAYGLIPVGSDAWLAKKQKPGPGSIVLIHGNGNEPLGIKEFLTLVRQERTAIKKKNWLLFDLRHGMAQPE